MPKSITSYNMLLSCPGDVVEFIPFIEKGVEDFNGNYGTDNNISINLLHWEKDAYPFVQRGQNGQNIINSQLLDKVDILLAVFWTRFGSPTDKYDSGTEEEINLILDNEKPVMLYFLKHSIPSLDEIDGDQINKLKKFKEEFSSSKNGLYRDVKDVSKYDFCKDLTNHFRKTLGNEEKEIKRDKEDTKRKRIVLWVDDRPENNIYGREKLQEIGIEVVIALSTNQALDWLSNHEASIIISDMGRKEGPREGYVLLDTLRERKNQTPYIIFASSREPIHIEETKKHNGQGCTNLADELLSMITNYFNIGYIPNQPY